MFIIQLNVNAWLTCILPVKSPNNDLQFIKYLKLFETTDRAISRVSIIILCNHLWYLTEDTAAISFFDDSVPPRIKHQMVKALMKAMEKPVKLLNSVKPNK